MRPLVEGRSGPPTEITVPAGNGAEKTEHELGAPVTISLKRPDGIVRRSRVRRADPAPGRRGDLGPCRRRKQQREQHHNRRQQTPASQSRPARAPLQTP